MNLDSRINGGILGCNLFAYCLNNPVNYFDDCGQLPIALIPVAVALEEYLINLGATFFIFGIAEKMVNCFTSLEPQDIPQPSIPDKPSTKAQGQAETKVQSKADTKAAKKTDSNTVYYGCRISNHNMVFLTGAMTYNEAYLWAVKMSLGTAYGIGKGSSWGLYTQYRKDAYAMAFALGSNTEPIYDAPMFMDHYPHYHTSGRTFNGIFKHFHVWFSC